MERSPQPITLREENQNHQIILASDLTTYDNLALFY